jgi:hypothetical protein
MPKNNIFESIENNEIVKNLVDDSKKMFDEFLGLVQGKKIREGNTALSAGTPAGTSVGTYVAEYALREFTKWKSTKDINLDTQFKTCIVDISSIPNSSFMEIPKSVVKAFIESSNNTTGISNEDIFIDLYILSNDAIVGKLESLIPTDYCSTPTTPTPTPTLTTTPNNKPYYLLTCIPKTPSDHNIDGISVHVIDKIKNKILKVNTTNCLLSARKGTVLTAFTKTISSPHINMIFLAKNGHLYGFNYDVDNEFNIFGKEMEADNNNYLQFYTQNDVTVTDNYIKYIDITFNGETITYDNNTWKYVNKYVPNRDKFSITGSKNVQTTINDIIHTQLIFLLSTSENIYKLSDLSNSKIRSTSISIGDNSNYSIKANLLEDAGIFCFSDYMGCYQDWPDRTAGLVGDQTSVSNTNQTKAMHDANLYASDNNKNIFAMQYDNQVFTPANNEVSWQILQTIKATIQKDNTSPWWDFAWFSEWYDELKWDSKYKSYSKTNPVNITDEFSNNFKKLSVNYNNKNFAEAKENSFRSKECQYDPESGYIRGAAWANAFYKTMDGEQCFNYEDVNLILDGTGLYIETSADGKLFNKEYIFNTKNIISEFDENTDLLQNPDWMNQGYAFPTGKMKYNEFLCTRAKHKDSNNTISDIEYITDAACKLRVLIDLTGTFQLECNFNPCSSNFSNIVKSIQKSYCNVGTSNNSNYTSLFDPRSPPSGSQTNSLTYMQNKYFTVLEKDPNNNTFSNIDAVYLKFNSRKTINTQIQENEPFYYKLNKNSNMQNCGDMKELSGAYIFNTDGMNLMGSMNNYLGSETNQTSIDKYGASDGITNITKCKDKCKENINCYAISYNETPDSASSKQCILYNKNIGNYLYDKNSFDSTNTIDISQKVFAKFCGPYAKDTAGNYDQNLLDASFINTLYTPQNSSFPSHNNLILSKGSWDSPISRDPSVNSIPANYTYNDDSFISNIIRDNSHCYNDNIAGILKLKNKDKIPSNLITKYEYPSIPFAKINNPNEEISNYYTAICSGVVSYQGEKSMLTGSKRTGNAIASQVETFTNMNESNESLKYTYIDNDMLNKIDNDTRSINELMYNFNKYLYKSKYDLKSGIIPQNHFFNINNIIFMAIIIVFIIILIRLLYRKK